MPLQTNPKKLYFITRLSNPTYSNTPKKIWYFKNSDRETIKTVTEALLKEFKNQRFNNIIQDGFYIVELEPTEAYRAKIVDPNNEGMTVDAIVHKDDASISKIIIDINDPNADMIVKAFSAKTKIEGIDFAEANRFNYPEAPSTFPLIDINLPLAFFPSSIGSSVNNLKKKNKLSIDLVARIFEINQTLNQINFHNDKIKDALAENLKKNKASIQNLADALATAQKEQTITPEQAMQQQETIDKLKDSLHDSIEKAFSERKNLNAAQRAEADNIFKEIATYKSKDYHLESNKVVVRFLDLYRKSQTSIVQAVNAADIASIQELVDSEVDEPTLQAMPTKNKSPKGSSSP